MNELKKQEEPWVDALAAWLRQVWGVRSLYLMFRLLALGDSGSRPVLERRRSLLGTTVAILALSASVWFLAVRIGYYFKASSIYDDPAQFNLTKAGVVWDVFYGESPDCAGTPCHLTADYPATSFTKSMVLPAREFPLLDWRRGQMIYARAHVTIPPAILAQQSPIAFHSLYLWAERYTLYMNGRAIDEGGVGTLVAPLPREIIPPDGRVFFAIKMDPGMLPYQGVANRVDLLIGPRDKVMPVYVHTAELQTTYYLWFLLPKLTFLMVFVLLFLAVPSSRELQSFVVFAFLASAESFFQSGYAAKMIPVQANFEMAYMIVRNLARVVFLVFLQDFFRRRTPLARRAFFMVLWFVVGSSILAAILPWSLGYIILDVVASFLRPLGFLYGAYLAVMTWLYLSETGQSAFRARICFFMGLFFVFAFAVASRESINVIGDLLGLNIGGYSFTWMLDLVLFLVLSTFTSMEFGLSITQRARLKSEVESYEERMDLASSVQQLLLPSERRGRTPEFEYAFYYEPADKVAGDWIHRWKAEDGSERLFIGDVVGKGPQAALAASAIASTLVGCRRDGLDTPATILRIDELLQTLFRGHVSTTLYAANLKPDGTVDIFTAGGFGWVVVGREGPRMIPCRSSLLGMGREPVIAQETLTLAPGDILYAFSDGCLEGQTALKRLKRELTRLLREGRVVDPDLLWSLTVEVGREYVHPDDKTMMVIRRR